MAASGESDRTKNSAPVAERKHKLRAHIRAVLAKRHTVQDRNPGDKDDRAR
jgi:hypothetical protein